MKFSPGADPLPRLLVLVLVQLCRRRRRRRRRLMESSEFRASKGERKI